MDKKYYTYIIRCADNTLYCGITTDLDRRLKEHQEGKLGAKYTKRHQALYMEAAWKSFNRSTASKLEYYIKHLNKCKKEQLIKSKVLIFDSESKLNTIAYEKVL